MAAEKFDPYARRRARRLLVQALYQWQLTGATSDELEGQFANRKEFGRIDPEFFSAVLTGVIRRTDEIDALLAPLLDRTVAELDQVERAILRAGTFELEARIDVPFKVVIDEYVALAKTFGAADSHRYVNGVLDALSRTLRPVEKPSEA